MTMRVLGACGLVALGVLVAFLLRTGEQPRVVRIPSVRVETVTEDPATSETAARPSPTGVPVLDDDAPPEEALTLVVSVREAGTGRAVPNAAVTAIPYHERKFDSGLLRIFDSDGALAARTDVTGACRLSVRSGFAGWSVGVAADGFAAADKRVKSDMAELAVHFDLAPGGRLSGTVSASDGTPVAKLPLVAVPEHVVGGSLIDRRVHSSAAPGVAVTDETGRFSFESLAPGEYRIEGRGDGWRLRDSPAPRGSTQDGRSVHLVADAVRVFRIALVHADSDVPVTSNSLQWNALGDAVEGGAWSLADRERLVLENGAELRTGWDGAQPGRLAGFVVLRRPVENRKDARLLLQVANYRLCIASVRLMLPGEALAGGQIDRVRLVPETPFQLGTVICDYERLLPSGFHFEPRLVMAVKRPTHDAVLRGQRVGESTWFFSSAPAGDAEVFFYDGLSNSIGAKVQVHPDRPTRVRPEWPPLSGVTFVIRDPESAEVVSGAGIWVSELKPDGGDGAVLDASAAGRFRMADGELKRGLYGLYPGRYSFSVAHGRKQRAQGEFELYRGEIKTIHVDLVGFR